MSRKQLVVLAVLALLALANVAFAQSGKKPAMKAELEALKVVAENGVEKFVPAKTASPGDVIEYRAVYTNTGIAPVPNVKGLIPIPSGMEYVPNSASAKAEASTDGKQFGPIPLKRVVMKDGAQVEEQVPYSQYKFIRWNFGTVAAGAKAQVKARARVVK